MKKALFPCLLAFMFLPFISFAQVEDSNKKVKETSTHYSMMNSPYFVVSISQGNKEFVYKAHQFENGNSEIYWMKPDAIESMQVLKGKNATEKYGFKGNNGVIEVKLKSDFYGELPKDIKAKFLEVVTN